MVVASHGAHVERVGHVDLIVVGGVVFAPDQRQVRLRRGLDLVVNFLYRAAHHLIARNILIGVEDVAGLVVAVDVGGNEVEGNFILGGVLDHVANPGSLGRRRTAHAQARADRLNVARGVVVEFEVRLLARRAGPEIEIRLVPHFEVPGRNFLQAVAIDQVLHELGDHVVPLGIVLGRRDIGVIPEGLQIRPRGQLVRHEAELDEGLHVVGQQAIVDLVDVGEVVDRLALLVFVVNADIVIQDAVKANVLEAGDLAHRPQVAAIGIAQAEHGPAGAEHLLPEMRKGMSGCGSINGDGFHGGLSQQRQRAKRENSQQQNRSAHR